MCSDNIVLLQTHEFILEIMLSCLPVQVKLFLIKAVGGHGDHNPALPIL